MHVRALAPNDRPALAALLSRIDNLSDEEKGVALELVDETIDDPARSTYRFRLGFDEAPDGTPGALIGYVCFGKTPMTRRTFDLYWIVVDKALQGRGIGRSLLGACEAAVRDEGGLTVRVETASKESYGSTIAFYERTKFALSGRIADFYDDGDDLLIFTKRVV
jgi:ribosomal protein S18 acetylase RimI-like enzyme